MCDCDIKVPPSRVGYFIFGNLKVIKLCGIIFTIEQSLVIRFSVLKNFEMKNCSWLSAHDVTIEAPLLENVFIEQDCESANREPRSCKIKFTASCIKEFTYSGCCAIPQPIVLSNSSAARNASVTIILDNDWRDFEETNRLVYQINLQLVILLKQFSEVKCIKFDASEVLTQPTVALLSKFAMLTHLDLGSVSGEVLFGLLQKSPVLNTLIFEGISKFDQDLLNSAVVPDCLASTLQVVEFGIVEELEPNLSLAKFFMENGMVLERMSFSAVG
ncbi:uncharacterized protein LOC123894966 [Trifolium pratense]|uniref:uncharacterized protein LOC123894966 n=1 Tax=Trifolium pratense TaxID=57577 RepID=UPI001E696312|nr:uncharacterized protein LOC123894966 [Trifolium pratense]XP_045801095.1 uncharacterized protein LOC123894966 [Trifolium pratense]